MEGISKYNHKVEDIELTFLRTREKTTTVKSNFLITVTLLQLLPTYTYLPTVCSCHIYLISNLSDGREREKM